MNKLKKVVINTFAVLAICLIVGLAGLIALESFGGIKSLGVFTVKSGSMEPSIRQGSLIFTIADTRYLSGDIITFASAKDPKIKTTHRVQNTRISPQGVFYRTKGDANQVQDFTDINHTQVIGKTFVSLPYLGFFLNFLKTERGLILFIIIPATIIVYEELKNLTKETKSLLAGRNRLTGQGAWRKITFACIFLFFLSRGNTAPFFLTIEETGAFYREQKTVLNNSLTSASVFGNVILELTADKKRAKASYINIGPVKEVSYTLTYKDGEVTRAIQGQIGEKPDKDFEIDIDLALSCSDESCLYPENPENFLLTSLIEWETSSAQIETSL